MKRRLVLVFWFASFLVLGQYQIGGNIGYNQLLTEIENPYSNYSLALKSRTGVHLNLGIRRKFSPIFSHTLGLGSTHRKINYATLYQPNSYSTIQDTLFSSSTLNLTTLQLHYLAHIYPFKSDAFSFSTGLALEHFTFEKTKSTGIEAPSSSKDGGPFNLNFLFGLNYEIQLSDQLNFFTSLQYNASMFKGKGYLPTTENARRGDDLRFLLGIYQTLDWKPFSLKETLKTRKTKFKTAQKQFNLNLFLNHYFGYRRFIFDETYDSYNCSYCTESMRISPSKYRINGFIGGIQIAFHRLKFNVEMGNEIHEEFMNTKFRRDKHHFKQPHGKIVDYYEEREEFDFKHKRMNFSIGAGYSLVHPDSRFTISPTFKFTQSTTISTEVKHHILHKERYYHWDTSPNPSSNFQWDSTSTNNRFSFNDQIRFFQIGSNFTFRITQKLKLNCDLYYVLRPKNIFILPPTIQLLDQTRWISSFGIQYQLLGKELKKKLKNENP